MAVVDSDILLLCSAGMPEDDVSASGGAIDTTMKASWNTPLAAPSQIEILSDNAADTMNVTIVGRLASGAIASEVKALSGTTPVASTNTFERILKVTCASTPAGTVTVRVITAGATIDTIEGALGILGFRGLFYNAASDPGSAKTFYEKVFVKNTNGTTAVSTATIQVVSPGPSGPADFTVGVDDAVDGTASVGNRLTAPTLASGFVQPGVAINVPGGSLGAGAAIGTWLAMNLSAGNIAVKETATVRLSGTSV